MNHPVPAETGPVLRATDVDVVREGTRLLTAISVQVHPGQHWALLGANGAGKSTLLSLLGAHTHPTRGSVEVLGHRLGAVDMRALRSLVGHINPRHPLQSPLTVRQVVLTGLTNTTELVPRWQPSADDSARADRLISLLGITDRAYARWNTLSQGERGRALIARALMPQPRLLLLDEPATGLDLAAREQLLTSLEDLRTGHPRLATVLVTHHLEELPAGTTHAMLLREGHCLAAGEVDEVITSDHISKCFNHPVHITRDHGRWHARAR
ncbi:ABC transporter ATP-binding protein [Saccharopolyspora mangrovi]|uniref:ATP-binding cassette domain-containing protein n=1 Tax=Saccharopolyspora mangrovi TaxID=3082379 RepID=A0ABU6AH83_9PSEU|nr:ATP-binding cassette domain-containing protein [Saccharopolyspora sp. S2-29]MEB3370832.1 ATP-binding cassette domain-containing protein [Saccharopolyspora sp. S2-29]